MERAATWGPRRASGYASDEYLKLIDEGVLGEDDHVELLEGVIVAGEPQNPPHASGVWRIQRLLERELGERAIVRVQLDYIAGRRSVPEPDIAVVPFVSDGYARSTRRGPTSCSRSPSRPCSRIDSPRARSTQRTACPSTCWSTCATDASRTTPPRAPHAGAISSARS